MDRHASRTCHGKHHPADAWTSPIGFGGEPSLGTLTSVLGVIGGVLAAAEGGDGLPEGPASSGPFSAVYAFGDSLTDAGNVSLATLGTVPVSPPYVSGHFTNGPVWAQDGAQDLGMPAPQPSLAGGTDFAYGGAQTGSTPAHTANPTDLVGQYAQFLLQDPRPQPDTVAQTLA
ncbi:MAG TPA: SGNH/GDSL hydrolase family protein [Acetobacteraceae bacterium]|nr:SGNH/GDSL hydrolase family protein [Acetobacteraceae bacterium]